MTEQLSSSFRNNEYILRGKAADPVDIVRNLDRQNHARPDGDLQIRLEEGPFMRLQSDAVSDVMAFEFRVPRFPGHLDAGREDLADRPSGAHGLDSGLQRLIGD